MAGLYIHIPFCRQSCYYCDFHFSTNRSYQNDMVEAMMKELVIQRYFLKNERFDTIYFGGGTPSILSPHQIEGLLNTVHQNYNVSRHPEITLEANPDDLSAEKLSSLHALGINRLSVGIQSFDNPTLQFLNRAHDSKDALNCIKNARAAGFENISIDLIFAIPGFSNRVLRRDLETALSLNPEHISLYSLTVEEKTVFGNWLAKGKLRTVADSTSARQFEYLINQLEKNDYEHYEVSNFCRDGHYSRHNTSYWKNINYLGIGPAAHSYDGSSRQHNVAHNPKYIKSLQKGIVPFEREVLDRKDLANEYLLTTLRTKWGCNLQELKAISGYDIAVHHPEGLDFLTKRGLIRIADETLYLTRKGLFVADDIIERLLQE